MSITKKTQFNRVDFTYDSEDGESYSIIYIDTGDREYFEVSTVPANGSPSENVDKKIYDVKMWKEILSERDKIKKPPEIIKVDRSNLQRPKISDFRNSNGPDIIQENIDHSMSQLDDSSAPIESFSAVGETPEEWKVEESDEEGLTNWKKDVKYRKDNLQRPAAVKARGNMGLGFKRVGAEDLI